MACAAGQVDTYLANARARAGTGESQSTNQSINQSCAAGVPVADSMFIPLSEPMEVWHFDMLSPPEESDRRTLDVTFNRLVDVPL